MLGEHIRNMRKEKKLTLTDFARITELSPGYISQIERGLADPSLTSLQRIAEALDIPAMLLLDNSPTDVIHYTPRDKQPLVTIPESDNVKYRICSVLPSSQFMPSSLLVEFFLKPRSQDFPSPISHDTEELLLVTGGSITVHRMGDAIEMHAGDTLIIPKDVPHVITNDGDEEAVGYFIMTPAIWSLKN